MKNCWYVNKGGFSLNEGGTPVNLHISWNKPWAKFFVYAYLFGFSFSWCWKKK